MTECVIQLWNYWNQTNQNIERIFQLKVFANIFSVSYSIK